MNLFSELAIISLAIGLAHFALFGYLMVKRWIRVATSNLLLAYLGLAVIWNFLIFAQSSGVSGSYFDPAWVTLTFYPLVLIGLSVWGFTQVFLEKPVRQWWAFIFIIAMGSINIAIDFRILSVPTLTIPVIVSNGDTATMTIDQSTSVIWLTGATMFIFLGLSFFSGLWAQYQTYSPRHRNRIEILLISILFLGVGLGFYLSFQPLLQGIGLIITWISGPIMIYIVLNQDLPDITRVLKRFVNFVVITLVTLIFYGTIVYILQTMLTGIPNAAIVTAIIAAILLTTLYLPLRELTQTLVERILFRHRYNNAQIIRDYIQATNNILFIKDLVNTSLTFIGEHLNIEHGAFFLLSKQDTDYFHFNILARDNDALPDTIRLKKNTPLTKELIDYERSVAQYNLDLFPEFRQADAQGAKALKALAFEQYVPIRRNRIMVGLIALGPYTSGEPYTIRDIELFTTLAAQTAISLENARLFDNVRHNLKEITRIKELMDNVFASIKSGVITASTTDEILMVNEAARQILNLPDGLPPSASVNALMQYMKNTPLPALFRDVKSSQCSYHNYEMAVEIQGRGMVNLSVDLTPIEDAQKRIEGVAMVIHDMTETNRLKAVQDMFRTYLSPAVVDRLPNDPAQLKLGGQRQEVSILFADIRGFTTFSEFQAPEDLINILNQYLSMAAEAILVYEGTLDKFMGDAVMAIFNAPLSQPDHPLRAVRAAVAMQKRLMAFYQAVGEQAPQLQFGVGIHVGEAVVGNVGTNSRMDYTAIGDAVNLAKRIQENTPGGKILLSQNTYYRVSQYVNAIPHDSLTVRGRQEPEQTYELLDMASVFQERVVQNAV